VGKFSEWLLVAVSGGIAAAAAFAMTAEPLQTLGPLEISFWLVTVIITLVAILAALILVDLKRVFGCALGLSFFASLFYGLALWSPAAQLGHYSTHLLNYAMVQAVPVLIITIVLATLGALVGTFINTSVREFDL
jgi:hypothetical protein